MQFFLCRPSSSLFFAVKLHRLKPTDNKTDGRWYYSPSHNCSRPSRTHPSPPHWIGNRRTSRHKYPSQLSNYTVCTKRSASIIRRFQIAVQSLLAKAQKHRLQTSETLSLCISQTARPGAECRFHLHSYFNKCSFPRPDGCRFYSEIGPNRSRTHYADVPSTKSKLDTRSFYSLPS